MTWIVMACLTLLAALAQALMPPVSILGQAKAPFLLAVVLYYALRREGRIMLAAVFVAGLLQDGLGHAPMGFSVLLFLAAGMLAAGSTSVVMTDTLVTAAFFGFFLAGVTVLAGGIALRATGFASLPVASLFVKALGSALLGGLCVPLVFVFAEKIDLMAGNIKRKDDIHGCQ